MKRSIIILLTLGYLIFGSCNKNVIEVTDNEFKASLSAVPSSDAMSMNLIFALDKGTLDKPYTLSYKMDRDVTAKLTYNGSTVNSPFNFTFDIDSIATFNTGPLVSGTSHHIEWVLKSAVGVTVSGSLDFTADNGGQDPGPSAQYGVSFTETIDSSRVVMTLAGQGDRVYVNYMIDDNPALVLERSGGSAFPSGTAVTLGRLDLTMPVLAEGNHRIFIQIRREGEREGFSAVKTFRYTAPHNGQGTGGGGGGQDPAPKDIQCMVSFTENADSTLVVMTLNGQGDKVFVSYTIDDDPSLLLNDASGNTFPSGMFTALNTLVLTMPVLDEGEHRIWISLRREGEEEKFWTVETFEYIVPRTKRLWFEDTKGTKMDTLNLWGGNAYDISARYKRSASDIIDLSSAQSWDSWSVEYFVDGQKVLPGADLIWPEAGCLKTMDWYRLSLLEDNGSVKTGNSAWSSGGLTYVLTVTKDGSKGTLAGTLQGTLGVLLDMGTPKDANGRYRLYVCEDNRTPDYVTFVYPSATKGVVVRDRFGVRKKETGAGVQVDFGAAHVKDGGSCSYKDTYPRTLTSKEYSKSASANTVTVEAPYTFAGTRPALGQNSYSFDVCDPFVMSGTTLLKRNVTVPTALYSPVKALILNEETEVYNMDHDDKGYPYNYVDNKEYRLDTQCLDIQSSSYEKVMVHKVSLPKGLYGSGVAGRNVSYSFLRYDIVAHDGHDQLSSGYTGVVYSN